MSTTGASNVQEEARRTNAKTRGPPRIEVVIVTWNSSSDIGACLEHVFRNTTDVSFHVTVIDNASADETRELLLPWRSKVEVLAMPQNLGWIGAVNLCLTTIEAEFLFFLNPDARVQAGWIRPLVDVLLERPRVAFATPKFIFPDGRIQSAGFCLNRLLRPAPRGFGEIDNGQYDESQVVPFCNGMFLVRRNIVGEIGILDRGFGLGYFEDLDYVLRARYRGFQVYYVHRSRISHAEGTSFTRLGTVRQQILTQNWLRFMFIHWPWSWILVRTPIEATLPIRLLLRGSDPMPVLRGWRAWVTGIRSTLARRREISNLRAISKVQSV
jgi:GT2 family glycosyltransferase